MIHADERVDVQVDMEDQQSDERPERSRRQAWENRHRVDVALV
jgi:hypothetical protein